MADRKTPFRFLMWLATLTCLTLASLNLAGIYRPGSRASPSAGWVSPSSYAAQSDNPMPPRARFRQVPDQFSPIVAAKKLNGTQVANVVVRRDRVDEMVGNATVWTTAYGSGPGAGGQLTLPVLAALVARSPHADWLRQTAPGVYLLSAGVVQGPGTRLEVSAPEVTELRLAFQPYVYISGVGATGVFAGVKVTSWVPASGVPAPNPADHRPYVDYDDGGRLDIANSEFCYLGTDSSKAYGVSWGTGTTGTATGSVFHHNLFGAYTGGAVGVTFKSNVFRNNARYGLDPHTNSSGLVVVDNEAYQNNTHGIIFSKNVNHSIVAGNRTHDNGSNGIMMDESSSFDVVTGNQSWNNRGDGIVIQGSSHDVVSGNRVSGNAVGVRVNSNKLGMSEGTRVADNQISGNRHGIQVYGGARDTITEGNQITDTADQAINFVDPATSQSDTVTGARKAIVVAHDATIDLLTTSAVGRSLVLAQGAHATVRSSQLTGTDIAVEVGPDAHLGLVGADTEAPTTISGARKAMVVDGTVDLRDAAIHDVDRGVLVDGAGHVTITTSSILSKSKGVEVQGFNGQSRVQLAESNVQARDPVVGSTLWQNSGNTLSSIPSWLAVAGALFVLLASLLHVGHRIFGPRSSAPRHTWTPSFPMAPPPKPALESAPEPVSEPGPASDPAPDPESESTVAEVESAPVDVAMNGSQP